jgi:hypothetical protein
MKFPLFASSPVVDLPRRAHWAAVTTGKLTPSFGRNDNQTIPYRTPDIRRQRQQAPTMLRHHFILGPGWLQGSAILPGTRVKHLRLHADASSP